MQSGNKDKERHSFVLPAEHQRVTYKLAGAYTTANKCYNSLYRASIHPFPFLDSPGKGGNTAKLGSHPQGLSQATSAFTGKLTPGFMLTTLSSATKEGDNFRCLHQTLEHASSGE